MSEKERKQLNIRLETELYEFIVKYSEENYKTVTAIIREMIADLYKQSKLRIAVDENGNAISKK